MTLLQELKQKPLLYYSRICNWDTCFITSIIIIISLLHISINPLIQGPY